MNSIDVKSNVVLEIGKFTMLWNLFELRFFGRNFRFEDIGKINLYQKLSMDYLVIIKEAIFLKNKSNNIDDIIERFSIRDNEKKYIIENNLVASDEPEKIIMLIILLIYRIRNNMFHGLKDIYSIEEQEELFKVASDFLERILGEKIRII